MANVAETFTSGTFIELTKDNNANVKTPRALWVGTAGTANLRDEHGNIRMDFPLLQGLNPIRISQLRSGGDADDIWGLY